MQSPAKVNLRLKIEGLRADGYHLLSMLSATVGLSDQIDLKFGIGAEIKLEVSSSNEISVPLDIHKNLASRAAIQFLQEFGLNSGLVIKITKNIPIGGGLGGGSSNAATVLKMLVEKFSNQLCANLGEAQFRSRLESIALGLGADVPFFLRSGLSRVSGIGEQIECLPSPVRDGLSGYPCCLLIPKIMVATPIVFEQTRAEFTGFNRSDSLLRQATFSNSDFVDQIISLIDNDLMPATFKLFPKMQAIFEELNQVSGYKVSMSGSGSSFLALPVPSKKYANGAVWRDFTDAITRHDLLVFDTNFVFL